MKKDIEVTCGASKIDVRVNKNYFKEKRMDLRNIDQLTMSKNGTNCIPTYDRNTESYRFIIFAPFTMCNTQVVHETEGKILRIVLRVLIFPDIFGQLESEIRRIGS